MLSEGFCIHFVRFTFLGGLGVHTASASLVSKALHNSTTIVLSLPLIYKTRFNLPNFTFEQVQELLSQYTAEVGQPFTPETIEAIHKQTAGQPVLVNRFAQILTEELDIPKSEPITMEHFSEAHIQLLREGHTNIDHLITNIHKDRRFEALLMKIASYDEGVRFSPYNEYVNELTHLRCHC